MVPHLKTSVSDFETISGAAVRLSLNVIVRSLGAASATADAAQRRPTALQSPDEEECFDLANLTTQGLALSEELHITVGPGAKEIAIERLVLLRTSQASRRERRVASSSSASSAAPRRRH